MNEKRLINTLVKALRNLGYRVMAEVEKGYRGSEPAWVEIDSISRSTNCAGGVCVNTRVVGNKTTSSTSIVWFTGNYGVEKIR